MVERPPKESIGCVARFIRANPARRDWNRSSTRSTRSGKPARHSSHRSNGVNFENWRTRADPDAALVRAVLRRVRLGLCGGASRYLVEEGCSRMTRATAPPRKWDGP